MSLTVEASGYGVVCGKLICTLLASWFPLAMTWDVTYAHGGVVVLPRARIAVGDWDVKIMDGHVANQWLLGD